MKKCLKNKLFAIIVMSCLMHYYPMTVQSYEGESNRVLLEEDSWKANEHSQGVKKTLNALEGDLNDDFEDSFNYATRSSRNEGIIDSLEVTNMEIKEVLELIALKSGLEIIGADQFTGKVSIFLKDIAARDALRIILDTNGLAFREVSGTKRHQSPSLIIMTAREYKSRYGNFFNSKIQAKIIQLQYVDFDDSLLFLRKLKTRVGKIILNREKNTLILLEDPFVLQSMDELIKQIDVKVETKRISLKHLDQEDILKSVRLKLTPKVGKIDLDDDAQVMILTETIPKMREIESLIQELSRSGEKLLIEVKVIQITLNDEHQQGVDWEAIVTDFQAVRMAKERGEIDQQEILSLGTVSQEDYTILLDALDTVGAINNVSFTKMEIVNHGEEKFLVSSLEVFKKKTLTLQEKEKISQIREVQLKVSPTIRDEKRLVVEISAQKWIKTPLQESSGFGKPTKPLVVEMDSGATIVVGGLLREVSIEFLRKIPLLGDLPLLGFAFRNHRQREYQAEVIVFLTIRQVPPELKNRVNE